MNHLKDHSKRWFDSAMMLPVPAAVAASLPGLIAAANYGGLGASVTQLLPILLGSDTTK
jgi:hypothetical protein